LDVGQIAPVESVTQTIQRWIIIPNLHDVQMLVVVNIAIMVHTLHGVLILVSDPLKEYAKMVESCWDPCDSSSDHN